MHNFDVGLSILHGNRLETLRDVVFEWVDRHPLTPLEEEIFLVQSNGVAEWLKMALARKQGICSSIRVELPARFLWRAWRSVLGDDHPSRSPTDKDTLTWRLMSLLPELLHRPAFHPLANFLLTGDWTRRFQLAARLSDLLDQYQVYRADWLDEWAAGHASLPRFGGSSETLSSDQLWQSLLWQEVVASLDDDAMTATRPAVHRRFIEALSSTSAAFDALPRRIVVFGLSSIPQTTVESLVALSSRCQVLVAVPNPCRFHWADTIDGRELLRVSARRHSLRGERDLAEVPLQDLHLHAHPLLAAWGRQGRDLMQQLDRYDDAAAAMERTGLPRVDLFDDADGSNLLEQIQARIRDLVPMAEHPAVTLSECDRSVVFHIAHSPQREVEVLHDQLLAILAEPSSRIAPRDIIVMVPDVETFAPAVRAVFGQYARHDPRYIPFSIADLSRRQTDPLLHAVDWLLGLPHRRCTASDLQALLAVPAVAARFDLDEDERPTLARWAADAGIRWGVDEAHRSVLDLAACGTTHSWQFGLDRMLLGYANGRRPDDSGATHFDEIEPYEEVGGLTAAAVGSLAALTDAVRAFNDVAADLMAPTLWTRRLRGLLEDFFEPTDELERATVARLQHALDEWLQVCAAAGFDEPVPLTVVREAWLGTVDQPSLGQRFASGGVTFCTLLPMRAIPFEMVCLLGMNDGDYPRRAPSSDFDLMALPGHRRPGDRSRRDDDRYLMLEALLSARQRLYVSWSGRSERDNSTQPPSVLVSQLREYIAAGWGQPTLPRLTTEHPLQPFSRRYFEAYNGTDPRQLFTYAKEWRQAHAETAAAGVPPPGGLGKGDGAGTPPSLKALADFLKNPARTFFRDRLHVAFDGLPEPIADEELFKVDRLQAWKVRDALLQATDAPALNVAATRHLRRGDLPMGPLGQRERDALVAEVAPMQRSWALACDDYPQPVEPIVIAPPGRSSTFVDRLDELRSNGTDLVRIERTASKLSPGSLAADKFAKAWVMALAAAVCGHQLSTVVIGLDGTVTLPPLARNNALVRWGVLLKWWDAGTRDALPVPCKTSVALLRDAKPAMVYDNAFGRDGEVKDPYLARRWTDYEVLSADGRFEVLAKELWQPCLDWLSDGRESIHPAEQAVAHD